MIWSHPWTTCCGKPSLPPCGRCLFWDWHLLFIFLVCCASYRKSFWLHFVPTLTHDSPRESNGKKMLSYAIFRRGKANRFGSGFFPTPALFICRSPNIPTLAKKDDSRMTLNFVYFISRALRLFVESGWPLVWKEKFVTKFVFPLIKKIIKWRGNAVFKFAK